MTTPPTSAQKIPVPPIRHLTSIMVRNGAPAFAPPAPWEPNLFRVVNQSNRERNGLDHSGGSSDPRTLSTFATSLLLPSSPIHP